MSDTVRINPGDGVGDPFVHLAGVLPTVITLCGWVDVDSEQTDGESADCPNCWTVVEYCKGIRQRRPKHRAKPSE
jgi:hypothetical protein